MAPGAPGGMRNLPPKAKAKLVKWAAVFCQPVSATTMHHPTLPANLTELLPDGAGARVIVGMSGGVDSSVAAYLLQRANYRVQGLFMKNWEEDDGTEYCTAIADLEDAARVCDKLGIDLHTANFAAEYWDNVFEDFLTGYRANHTPNPDVLCNREIKFKQFADYASRLGAEFIATGHYARICRTADGTQLHKAADRNKDQTYFLQAVPAAQLRNALFPLGGWQKQQVRELAQQLDLHNHARKDSTGICFIGERRFDDFLARYIQDRPGAITDTSGRRLGQHRGLHHFTLGQRQGINLGGVRGRPEAPWYVAGKLAARDLLVVSQQAHNLQSRWLRATAVNWLQQVTLPALGSAKIRYRQDDQACRISAAADGGVLVKFDTPQRAVTPGQYVAFYDGTRLLGGARICATDTAALAPLQARPSSTHNE